MNQREHSHGNINHHNIVIIVLYQGDKIATVTVFYPTMVFSVHHCTVLNSHTINSH